jgi:hypothetical protein
MQKIHNVVKVINNQRILDISPEFSDNESEVILRSPQHKNTMIEELEREIDVGTKSPVSLRSHREIFDSLREKCGVTVKKGDIKYESICI